METYNNNQNIDTREFNEDELINEEVEIQETVNYWKEQFDSIYLSEIGDEAFIFRLLSMEEYRELKDIADNKYHLEELVCQATVLDPVVPWSEDIYAGFASTLSLEILTRSYILSSDDEPIDVVQMIEAGGQALNESLEKQMPLVINHCFKEYTLKELKYMPLPNQIELFIQAQWVLENLMGQSLSFNTEE